MLEELETMMKKECIFEKKIVFIFLKALYKNGKTQNMPVVAGRLVLIKIENRVKIILKIDVIPFL